MCAFVLFELKCPPLTDFTAWNDYTLRWSIYETHARVWAKFWNTSNINSRFANVKERWCLSIFNHALSGVIVKPSFEYLFSHNVRTTNELLLQDGNILLNVSQSGFGEPRSSQAFILSSVVIIIFLVWFYCWLSLYNRRFESVVKQIRNKLAPNQIERKSSANTIQIA